MRLLDSTSEPEAIPNKRPRKRVKLFRQGELGRMILGTLREADQPLSTAQIVTAILVNNGHGESAKRALSGRVRGNLAYLARNGKVTKDVDDNGVVWNLG